MIDGVGSWRRGLKFEGYLRKKMGQIEVQEQVEGLSFLVKQGFVDTERIAVTGWSYGGYLSLLCLAQRPDFFKVAVSAAPVTKWESYDTGYTERYMGTPTDNPVGYEAGSVMHYIDGFPDGYDAWPSFFALSEKLIYVIKKGESTHDYSWLVGRKCTLLQYKRAHPKAH
jgi:pimeloyl-ACP methyl ester carboxylesterase